MISCLVAEKIKRKCHVKPHLLHYVFGNKEKLYLVVKKSKRKIQEKHHRHHKQTQGNLIGLN